jgi:Holliday junction resolvase RusA-like endonuclease
MAKSLTFTVPGVPFSKRRHRTVPLLQCNGCGKKTQGQYKECPDCGQGMRFLTNLAYSDSETTRFENLVAYAAQQAMKQQGVEMFTGAIRVSPTFWFPIPVSRACKKHTEPTHDCKRLHAGDWHTQKPDRDNLDKAINDGMNGIVFPDDCIICDGRIQKFWANECRAEIVVEEL